MALCNATKTHQLTLAFANNQLQLQIRNKNSSPFRLKASFKFKQITDFCLHKTKKRRYEHAKSTSQNTDLIDVE